MNTRRVLTTCVYCGTGCTFYWRVRAGRVTGVVPDPDGPVNRGRLCVKGWSANEFVHHPDRLTTPLVRIRKSANEQMSKWRIAEWDEVLDLVASRLWALRQAHGPDSLAFLASAKCTNEENYLLQKLARQIVGTNNVDHCARL